MKLIPTVNSYFPESYSHSL